MRHDGNEKGVVGVVCITRQTDRSAFCKPFHLFNPVQRADDLSGIERREGMNPSPTSPCANDFRRGGVYPRPSVLAITMSAALDSGATGGGEPLPYIPVCQ
jgi:hypothetical protein